MTCTRSRTLSSYSLLDRYVSLACDFHSVTTQELDLSCNVWCADILNLFSSWRIRPLEVCENYGVLCMLRLMEL